MAVRAFRLFGLPLLTRRLPDRNVGALPAAFKGCHSALPADGDALMRWRPALALMEFDRPEPRGFRRLACHAVQLRPMSCLMPSAAR